MKMKQMNRILCLCLILLCCLGIFAGCGGCDHTPGAWIVDQEATYHSPGQQHTVCTRCGETLRSETVPQLICDHTDTRWIVDVEATLDATGSRRLVCNTCEDTLKTEVIPEITLTREEIIAKLSPSVVKVFCYDYDGVTKLSQGSGFFIDEGGAFITNAHVVKDCFFIKIQTHSGEVYDVDVMYTYSRETSDYAICRANSCVSQPVTFTERAAVGDRVYALGYPNDAPALCTTAGQITNVNGIDGTSHFYVNTAEIDHGSSGGVLSDAKGRVLGITTAMNADGQYFALKYGDFKTDAEGSLTEGKAPWEYFHTAKKVALTAKTAEAYFGIGVSGRATSYTNVSYKVTVQLREKHWKEKIAISGESVRLKVKLTTTYTYQETPASGKKSQTDTVYVEFTVTDGADFWKSVSKNTASAIPEAPNPCYGMKITYEVDFSGGSGTIVIYD